MKTLLACLVSVTLTQSAGAEEPLDPRIAPETLAAFAPAVLDDGEPMPLPYRLLSPEGASDADPRPLLLFLHGKGERGADNQRQLIHGGNIFASPEFRERHRAFVVAPQCPDGVEPGVPNTNPNDPGPIAQRHWTLALAKDHDPTVDLQGESTAQLEAVSRLADHLIETLPVDRKRVYVAGLSMGGYATWELLARTPERWAGAVAICGAGDPTHSARMAGVPVWAAHGESDSVVPVERSRAMIAALVASGARPVYTEYPGVGHDSWTPTLGSRHVWDWLFTQRR